MDYQPAHHPVLTPLLAHLGFDFNPVLLSQSAMLLQQLNVMLPPTAARSTASARPLVCIQLACENLMLEVSTNKLLLLSGLSRAHYANLFRQARQRLGLDEPITLEQLAVQFGSVQLVPQAEWLKQAFVEAYLPTLSAANRSNFQSNSPALIGACFYLCCKAAGGRIDRTKVILRCDTSVREFNQYITLLKATVSDKLEQLDTKQNNKSDTTSSEGAKEATPTKRGIPAQVLTKARAILKASPQGKVATRKRKADAVDEPGEVRRSPRTCRRRTDATSEQPSLICKLRPRGPRPVVSIDVVMDSKRAKRKGSANITEGTSSPMAVDTPRNGSEKRLVSSSINVAKNKKSYPKTGAPPSTITGITAMIACSDFRRTRKFKNYISWKRQLEQTLSS
ncbi:Origin of replication complex subunit 6 [Dispira parvispora]|uniref:Origin of replication complex subunit 6 n=1 Tax=Dispira parvispora TaxID=1520584 RepID=A0A9W8E6H4_9FUNG|nr:Origin of replication complex subunit 6 [Dispira parvispora]